MNRQTYVHLKAKLFTLYSSWVYLVLLLFTFIGLKFYPQNYSKVVVILSIVSFFWAISFYRRTRLIDDTPTTSLFAASQGYSELEGVVSLHNGEILEELDENLPPMVWFSDLFLIKGAGFTLDDDKGRCTIDPRNAEVITPLHYYNDSPYRGIYPGETIYVLGQLKTLTLQKTEFERNSLIAAKINCWKKNGTSFIKSFDNNNDGQVDYEEMEDVRKRASHEVDNDIELDYQQAATHVMSASKDGRPFILSSIHPNKLVKRYRRAMYIHLVLWLYFSFQSII